MWRHRINLLQVTPQPPLAGGRHQDQHALLHRHAGRRPRLDAALPPSPHTRAPSRESWRAVRTRRRLSPPPGHGRGCGRCRVGRRCARLRPRLGGAPPCQGGRRGRGPPARRPGAATASSPRRRLLSRETEGGRREVERILPGGQECEAPSISDWSASRRSWETQRGSQDMRSGLDQKLIQAIRTVKRRI